MKLKEEEAKKREEEMKNDEETKEEDKEEKKDDEKKEGKPDEGEEGQAQDRTAESAYHPYEKIEAKNQCVDLKRGVCKITLWEITDNRYDKVVEKTFPRSYQSF